MLVHLFTRPRTALWMLVHLSGWFRGRLWMLVHRLPSADGVEQVIEQQQLGDRQWFTAGALIDLA